MQHPYLPIQTPDFDVAPLEKLDLAQCRSFSDLAKALAKTAFGGRALGEAVDVAEAMVRDADCFKVLTLSGALTMAQMGLVICDMIDAGMADCIVSTGALIGHGLIETAGMAHFQSPRGVSDKRLYQTGFNRVYDTLEVEENMEELQSIVDAVLDGLDKDLATSSHELCAKFGEHLHKHTSGRGILKSAFAKQVPVFIPAFTDSVMGEEISLYNRLRRQRGETEIRFDPYRDLERYQDLCREAKKLAIFTVGGGVPRNWAQQVAPWLNEIRYQMVDGGEPDKKFSYDPKDPYNKRFWYGVRICPEPDHWGGLSGCNYSEGVSWGKFEAAEDGGRYAEVPCDATIALPIVVKAVLERLEAGGTA